MLFAFPYALLGAVALAGLVAVYTFRNRFRHRPVSSLMLWQQIARPRQGGTRRDTLQLPPLFYLELLTLAALVVAAAAPHLPRSLPGGLTVVLDASVSMSARDLSGTTAQERAVKALQRELSRNRYARVRLLAASADGPELLGTSAPPQAAARLARVACRAPADTLELTLARAGELSDAADEVLVLTDRPPRDRALRPGVRWQACGEALSNAAITYADRSWRADGTEALLVEVSGFALAERRVALRVRALAPDGAPDLDKRVLELNERGSARLVLTLPPGTPAVAVELPDDALAADNRAVLLPETPRPVAVAVRIKDERLRQATERALAASGRVRFEPAQPQLVFSDTAQTAAGAPCWQVLLVAPAQPRLVRGPYLTDPAQPLLEGVSFDGLVWAVGTNALPGRALAFAGSAPLLTLDASARQAPVLRMLAEGRSTTLFQSAAWPALVWNILQACAEAQPGCVERNLRAGAQTVFTVARGETRAVFDTPDGEKAFKARGGRIVWAPTQAGLYRMRQPEGGPSEFAVNLFAAEEADLRPCMTGAWGGKTTAARLQRTHQSYAWLAGLAALLLAGLHQWALCRRRNGEVRP